ncbi:oxygen-independent coproporphyrinogen-3 oxidase [Balneicella halophila]|uniref:Coproporphyrinogen-III oxidase n=1 Tax=Balneicella halophila TaxID=1537566 RepID=A0A7L4UPP6_BALHA|nr:oxygen-independent coproporphyrinogen III oxidase [Balneicella halophila]PVX51730.1 oxygen-independent coproporphyrinogen-3 oxidase [Balneicella halophila]
MIEELIKKYNVPVPRYTSYPTAPCWGDSLGTMDSIESIIKKSFRKSNTKSGISIYIHLPYCENLCTFCACNRIITKNHKVEDSYIEAVLTEWQRYRSLFDGTPIIRELHLGGGTPTFFSPENLKYLIESIMKDAKMHESHEFSFEAHPGITTEEHLDTLYNVGFNRVSFGVQDFDEIVQETINRKNDYETVKSITEKAREIGYSSVNYDLIYGLPKQKLSSVEDTIEKVALLMPERIAFYSYAHVPWKMKMQRTFTDEDLPDNAEKRALYEKGKELLISSGYYDIGLDHFSLESDDLYKAYKERRLHRNFMGYNTSHTKMLIGLGASSISDFDTMYIQNEKHVSKYEKKIQENRWAYERSYILTPEDECIKRAILDIACKRQLSITPEIRTYLTKSDFETLSVMQSEGLIMFDEDTLTVTDLGMIFLRNICSVFDRNYDVNKQFNFSKSI